MDHLWGYLWNSRGHESFKQSEKTASQMEPSGTHIYETVRLIYQKSSSNSTKFSISRQYMYIVITIYSRQSMHY